MKKIPLIVASIVFATSVMAADYEVYDIKIKGRAIESDFDGARIGSGAARGWLVYDWDTETSTFILLEKGFCEQGESEVDIYDYYDSSKETDAKYTEKGVTEIWYDIYFSDVNIWGCALGKYIWTWDYQTGATTSKCVLKGAGSLLIDDWYGGYASPMMAKSNMKITMGINEALSAEGYMEQLCLSQTGWPINLDWSWATP